MKLIKKENLGRFVLYIYEGGSDPKTIYRRVLNAVENRNLRKAVGRQTGQHKHRKPD
ncbi:MAG: hypothetical protein IJC65_00470 [Oscillospiraceae bacterium]|nr:hypothetical protein [Oscillospiraceae bacterium]